MNSEFTKWIKAIATAIKYKPEKDKLGYLEAEGVGQAADIIDRQDERIVELGDLLVELYDEAAYEKAGEWVLENKELQEKVKQALKRSYKMNEEREQEKTIEWYKAQAKETTDLKRITFHLWKNDGDELCGDEYFPDRVVRKYKQLEDEKEKLQEQIDTLRTKNCKLMDLLLDELGFGRYNKAMILVNEEAGES